MSRADDEIDRKLLRQHTKSAFAQLYRRHNKMVFGVCKRILHRHDDLCRNVMQETFLSLWLLPRSLAPRSMAGWLHTTAHNRALNVLRDERLRSKIERPPGEHHQEQPAEETKGAASDLVAKLLAQLTNAERKLVELAMPGNLTWEQIGNKLDMTADAARKKFERICKRLREDNPPETANGV